MGNKLKKVGLALVLCMGCGAQQRNTIYATLVTNYSTHDYFNAVIGSQYMIGQAYHQLMLILGDKTTNSCAAVSASDVTNFAPTINIYGSYDGVIYTDITGYTRVLSPNSGGASNRYTRIATAIGEYPFISISVSDFNNTDCKASIYYSGGLQQVDIRKSPDFSTTNDDMFQAPLYSAGAGSEVVITAANTTLMLYGIQMCGAQASGLNTVTITDTLTLSVIAEYTLTSGQCVSVGGGTYPIMHSAFAGVNVSNGITITSTAALTGFTLSRGE